MVCNAKFKKNLPQMCNVNSPSGQIFRRTQLLLYQLKDVNQLSGAIKAV